jgi:hypothetical protein
MMRRVFLVLVCLTILSATCGLRTQGAPAPAPAPKTGLKLAIAVPIHHDKRSIFLGEKAGSFYVVVTNTNDAPVKLWREWCSWGYYNLSFEIDQGGNKVEVKKKPRGWKKNFPDAQELKPGDSYVIPVSFDPDTWELPDLKAGPGKPAEVRMRALFSNELDESAREMGVWSGQVGSPWENYAIWSNR